jgi:hypothetical protein
MFVIHIALKENIFLSFLIPICEYFPRFTIFAIFCGFSYYFIQFCSTFTHHTKYIKLYDFNMLNFSSKPFYFSLIEVTIQIYIHEDIYN